MIDWNPIPDFRDKAIQIHAMSGAITSLGMNLFSPNWVHLLIAVTVVTSAKEVWAYFNPSKYQVSLAHAVATGLGGFAAGLFLKLLA